MVDRIDDPITLCYQRFLCSIEAGPIAILDMGDGSTYVVDSATVSTAMRHLLGTYIKAMARVVEFVPLSSGRCWHVLIIANQSSAAMCAINAGVASNHSPPSRHEANCLCSLDSSGCPPGCCAMI